MPELAKFLAPFTVQFAQRPSARALERYCMGLLAEHPSKNRDTLARAVPATSMQQLNALPTEFVRDDADLNRQRVRTMCRCAS